MNIIKDTIEYIRQLFTWWIEIMPWEQGIRVTLGKRQKLITAGIWLKVPIVHSVFIQPIRLRVIETPLQTVTTKNNVIISMKLNIGYQITDMVKLFNTISDPIQTLSGLAQGKLSRLISETDDDKISQSELRDSVFKEVNKSEYGLEIKLCELVTFAKARPYRLMGDNYWANCDEDRLSHSKVK